MTHDNYPRDLIGYGARPPHARWPDGARIALQFVLNYEEGGENNVLHGDAGSEQFLSEIIGAAAYPERHMSMEGVYEYGSRAARPAGVRRVGAVADEIAWIVIVCHLLYVCFRRNLLLA